MKINKKSQMPAFGWVFAIIIGVIILFLVAYFVGKMISTQTYMGQVELARNFDVLLNPFASIGGVGPISMGKTIKLPQETIIEFYCYDDKGGLGSQGMSLKSKSTFGKWGDFTEEMYIYDKYIFSENLQGKQFYVLSKSFELPFRIDDLIYIISDEYCFIGAPNKINEQLTALKVPNIKSECTDKTKKVCFDGAGGIDCDIDVSGTKCAGNFCDNVYEEGIVEKVVGEDSKEFTFVTDALMYSAIFSDEQTYGCNLNRLMNRLIMLCDIYEKKAKAMDEGCHMDKIIDAARKLRDSAKEGDVEKILTSSQELADVNLESNCQAY